MVMRVTGRQREIMFLNQGLVDLYLNLTKGPLVESSAVSGIAYSHALKMVSFWSSLGLINNNKSGQQYNFFYTAVGARLAAELVKLKVFMRKNSLQWVSDEEE